MSKISKHTLATILIQAILLTSFSPRGPYEGLRGLYEGLRAPYEGFSGLAYLVPERSWNFPGTIFFRSEILANIE